MTNTLSLAVCVDLINRMWVEVTLGQFQTETFRDIAFFFLSYSHVLLPSAMKRCPGFEDSVETHGEDLSPVSSLEPSPDELAKFHWTHTDIRVKKKKNSFGYKPLRLCDGLICFKT